MLCSLIEGLQMPGAVLGGRPQRRVSPSPLPQGTSRSRGQGPPRVCLQPQNNAGAPGPQGHGTDSRLGCLPLGTLTASLAPKRNRAASQFLGRRRLQGRCPRAGSAGPSQPAALAGGQQQLSTPPKHRIRRNVCGWRPRQQTPHAGGPPLPLTLISNLHGSTRRRREHSDGFARDATTDRGFFLEGTNVPSSSSSSLLLVSGVSLPVAPLSPFSHAETGIQRP